MKTNKRNVNLVCLFKGIKSSPNYIEIGGYVDALLSEPYSLAIAYLKAYAEKFDFIRKNYTINIFNLRDNGQGITDQVHYQSDFLTKIISNNPIAIGFSTYCWNIDATITIIKKIKKINPNIKIILGGRYALKEYLLRHPEIDFIIRGEGEIPFTALLREGFSQKPNIKGVSYRINHNNIVDGGESEILEDIDLIPSPFTMGIILPNKYNMMIELSRGCLNNCAYCNWNSNKKLRLHSENRILEELQFAIHNNLKHITIIDSAINYNIILLKTLSRAINTLKLKDILFSYNLRYEYVDNNQIRYLKNIPSFQVLLGLESINQEALIKANRKTVNTQKFINTIRLLNSYCKPLIGVILGLPYDIPESFKETIYFLQRLNKYDNLKIGGVLISLLQVFPDSPLHKKNYKIKTYKKGVPYIKSNITWNRKNLKNILLWLSEMQKKSELNIKGIEGGWRIKIE